MSMFSSFQLWDTGVKIFTFSFLDSKHEKNIHFFDMFLSFKWWDTNVIIFSFSFLNSKHEKNIHLFDMFEFPLSVFSQSHDSKH